MPPRRRLLQTLFIACLALQMTSVAVVTVSTFFRGFRSDRPAAVGVPGRELGLSWGHLHYITEDPWPEPSPTGAWMGDSGTDRHFRFIVGDWFRRREVYYLGEPLLGLTAAERRQLPHFVRHRQGLRLNLRHVMYILTAAVTAFALLTWRQLRRDRKRQARGLCLVCGYDLCASPERCPECGSDPVNRKLTAEA